MKLRPTVAWNLNQSRQTLQVNWDNRLNTLTYNLYYTLKIRMKNREKTFLVPQAKHGQKISGRENFYKYL